MPTGDETPTADEAASDEAGSDEADSDDAEPPAAVEERPPLFTFTRSERYAGPARDSYSLRLIAVRKLYDHGTLVEHSGSLALLPAGSALRVNPVDLQHLGVADGGQVKVSSARSTATVAAIADARVRPGTATMLVNQGAPDPADFIDAGAPATDLRVDRA
jgi:NADH-quinone oxidoreductase subunit G